jgi:hypothetical protein
MVGAQTEPWTADVKRKKVMEGLERKRAARREVTAAMNVNATEI